MTSNQIAFREHEEQARHNREMERLTGEQQAEVAQHNRQTEQLASFELAEKKRTNAANEAIKAQSNAINAVHYANQDELTKLKTSTDAYVSLAMLPAQIYYYTSQADLNTQKLETEKKQADLYGAQTNKVEAEKGKIFEETLTEKQRRAEIAANILKTYAATKTEQARATNLLFDNDVKASQKKYYDTQSDVLSKKVGSEVFKNYTSGINDITRSVGNTTGAILDIKQLLTPKYQREKIYVR